MHRILFVCHGNICRSPMAQYVLKFLVHQKGLDHDFYIASSATSSEELGNGIHQGTIRILDSHLIPYEEHYSNQITPEIYQRFDYIIGMDTNNIKNILNIVGSDPDHKVYRLLDFANEKKDVADPWYTGNFTLSYTDIFRGCKALLDFILQNN